MSPVALSILFFVQLAAILAVCRVVGLIFRKLGQSQVVSEMIAGVLLGPSLLGWISPRLVTLLSPLLGQMFPGGQFPNVSALLFPAASKPIIYAVSQLGLVLYMFLIGAELDLSLISKRVSAAVLVSVSGIAAPFALGVCLSLFINGDHALWGETVTPVMAGLFMGAAMSITAFPMLARIIYEQGLTKTSIGVLALTAGAFDDASAWVVLAIMVAAFDGNPGGAVVALGGTVLYGVGTLLGVPRLLRPLARRVEQEGKMPDGVFSVVLCLLMLGAWFTDVIHIYAVFGAFVMGIAMPRGLFQKELERKILPLTTNLLLPLFFIYSGLNMQIGLVNSPYLWLLTGLVLVAAVGGKLFACAGAARISGEGWRDSFTIGALMNARGLMELILLNIALERGIIRPPLFAVLVLMAVITTLMASPLFKAIRSKAVTDSPWPQEGLA